jgi:hypothetical protein
MDCHRRFLCVDCHPGYKRRLRFIKIYFCDTFISFFNSITKIKKIRRPTAHGRARARTRTQKFLKMRTRTPAHTKKLKGAHAHSKFSKDAHAHTKKILRCARKFRENVLECLNLCKRALELNGRHRLDYLIDQRCITGQF